jgi:hypothetical protein
VSFAAQVDQELRAEDVFVIVQDIPHVCVDVSTGISMIVVERGTGNLAHALLKRVQRRLCGAAQAQLLQLQQPLRPVLAPVVAREGASAVAPACARLRLLRIAR